MRHICELIFCILIKNGQDKTKEASPQLKSMERCSFYLTVPTPLSLIHTYTLHLHLGATNNVYSLDKSYGS